MSAILKHFAVAFGATIFLAVAVIGFTNDLPFFVIVFRGIVAMSIATVVFLSFAIFFQRLLYRFVAEQIMEQRKGPRDMPGQTPVPDSSATGSDVPADKNGGS
jgi:hypothetical protein